MVTRLEPLRLKGPKLKAFLEGLYFVYNRRELVHPDPLIFLYDYDDPLDREIAGLVSSCLAYGRVAQILKSVQKILEPMGSHPHRFLLRHSDLQDLFGDFKHRFTTGTQMADLLAQTSKILREQGSIEALMKDCLRMGGSLTGGLNLFARALEPKRAGFSLLTAPEDGSACKRLLLWLKWMVRRDDVDPGGWNVLSPRDLLMPTDTHIHHLALQLGLTRRKQADLKTAIEITQSFAALTPEDPTRYDFALTRFGIRTGLSLTELVELQESCAPMKAQR
ncbi:MAG: TIGR02757 family protein [Synergistaceae bacterium]|jgi:uncharacterized protein (TIGR02757 family)|nr:TIGR02757 family protein [Synergistaceae bacterium]